MKKRFKQIVAFSLALLMLLASCDSASKKPTDTTPETENEYTFEINDGTSHDTEPEDATSAPEDTDHLGDATFVGAGVSDPEEQPEDSSAPQPEGDTYFDKARANRTAAREEALGIIRDVLDNAQASAEDKTLATQRATASAENVLQESNIESLITAKGFADSVVYIEGDRCSVVVQAEELQQQESLQILEIVVSQAGVAPEKVQIVTAKT